MSERRQGEKRNAILGVGVGQRGAGCWASTFLIYNHVVFYFKYVNVLPAMCDLTTPNLSFKVDLYCGLI